MPFTGGGNPLPVVVACRWCEYETPRAKTNGAALNDLLRHVRGRHRAEYETVVKRPGVSTAHD